MCGLGLTSAWVPGQRTRQRGSRRTRPGGSATAVPGSLHAHAGPRTFRRVGTGTGSPAGLLLRHLEAICFRRTRNSTRAFSFSLAFISERRSHRLKARSFPEHAQRRLRAILGPTKCKRTRRTDPSVASELEGGLAFCGPDFPRNGLAITQRPSHERQGAHPPSAPRACEGLGTGRGPHGTWPTHSGGSGLQCRFLALAPAYVGGD